MDVDARLEALQIENERLRAEIERLQAEGPECFLAPVEWRLTAKETRLLACLLRRDMATKEQLMDGLYVPGADDEPMIKIIDVFVCKLRRKLRPFGIEIATVWGQGYRIVPAMKAKARAQAADCELAA